MKSSVINQEICAAPPILSFFYLFRYILNLFFIDEIALTANNRYSVASLLTTETNEVSGVEKSQIKNKISPFATLSRNDEVSDLRSVEMAVCEIFG